MLASGVTFKDVAAMSGMSISTAETSFHHFCEKLSEGLWETWVTLPVGDDLKKVEEIYRKCGLPGAVGSLDCTHFKWDNCPWSEHRVHTGKEGYPSVVVEAMCDHAGRITAATKSYPGAKNDQTVISRDQSVWRIRDEEPWKSMKYKLKNADGTETEYTGAWLIVDGGYPKVSCAQNRVLKFASSAKGRFQPLHFRCASLAFYVSQYFCMFGNGHYSCVVWKQKTEGFPDTLARVFGSGETLQSRGSKIQEGVLCHPCRPAPFGHRVPGIATFFCSAALIPKTCFRALRDYGRVSFF